MMFRNLHQENANNGKVKWDNHQLAKGIDVRRHSLPPCVVFLLLASAKVICIPWSAKRRPPPIRLSVGRIGAVSALARIAQRVCEDVQARV